MKFCNITDLKDLLKLDAQRYITRYVISLRDMKLASNSIKSRLNPVFHFYEMNDVALNKKKIKMFKGEFIKKTRDRAYTHDEIKKMLDVCDLRMKVVILLMASTGCRVGALPLLRLRNLVKMDNVSLYKITIYEGSNEQYFCYCTPECAFFIDAYLQYRETNGEKLTPDSFLIRDQFDINDMEQIRNRSRGVTIQTYHSVIASLLLKAGLRTIDHTSRHNRKEIMKCHGFRKFWLTQAIKSNVNPEIREMLLGHSIGLADSYYRPNEEDILQEYEKMVDNVTINEANRLRKKVQILQLEKSQMDIMKQDLDKFKQELEAMKRQRK